MTLYEQIIAIYPDLEGSDVFVKDIILQDDCDGEGAFIAKWEYSKPIPKGLKIGK